jgi:putative transposase
MTIDSGANERKKESMLNPAKAEKIALLRYQVISHVLSRVEGGISRSAAIAEISGAPFLDYESRIKITPRARTTHRWLHDYAQSGFSGLIPKDRRSAKPSACLPEEFITFLAKKKNEDTDASIPAIIKEAAARGIIPADKISRTTVWRTALTLNLPVLKVRKKAGHDKRRFEYLHRMQMVLCDGKKFRAGHAKKKRVVLIFIDDSTRKVLVAIVGKSETTRLFLRGIHKLIMSFGLPTSVFVDCGTGFISHDAIAVMARLGIHFIHGTAGYPEGHGKIERFNRTQWADLLRTFSGDPTVDPELPGLTSRCQHYTHTVYNNERHSSIELSPNEKWDADTMPLNIPEDFMSVETNFVMTRKRKVSRDNVIKNNGISLEMPNGYAGKIVTIEDHLLHNSQYFAHNGEKLRLNKVDLVANSKEKRLARDVIPEPEPASKTTAARVLYDRDFPPIVDAGGNCSDK